jgi:hypothetical protein
MADLDRQISDRVADGKLSAEDAAMIYTFRDFLAETPQGLTKTPAAGWPVMFASRAAFQAWRTRWLPYLVGLSDGPTTSAEYAELRPRLLRGKV